MRIVKSLHAPILHRALSLRGTHYFVVSALWGFRLETGEAVVELELWPALAKALGQGELFDAGMPKARGEFLVSGAFHAPGGEAVTAGAVEVRVGTLNKRLLVYGDRHWRKAAGAAMASAPAPFTRMPITYAQAFGGEGYAANPIGKGAAALKREQGETHPLPNLEDPRQPIASPSDRPAPISLGRVDVTWAPRQGRAGTYDERYLRERMPGYPDDLDPTFFNDAAEDQWLAAGFFSGDEDFEIRHMHPQRPLIRGRLPAVRARAFVLQGEEARAREVPLRLDTVWLLPEAGLGVVIHRGMVECARDDGRDVKTVLIAHEGRADAPRPAAHYQDEIDRRADPVEGFKYLLDTSGLIPAGLPCALQQIMGAHDEIHRGHTLRNMDEARERLRAEAEAKLAATRDDVEQRLKAAGMDPQPVLERMRASTQAVDPDQRRMQELTARALPMDEHGRLDIAKIDFKALDEIKTVAADKHQKIKAEATAQLERLLATLRQRLPGEPGLRSAVESVEQRLREIGRPPVLPRLNTDYMVGLIAAQNARVAAIAAQVQASGGTQAVAQPIDMAAVEAKLGEASAMARKAYLRGAHLIEAGRSPHEGREAALAVALREALSAGRPASGGDYAFVSLAGQALGAADVSGSLLEFCDLSATRWDGANLSEAVLAHADLSGARFVNCDLRGANLGRAILAGTEFVDCDLTGACLSHAQLSRARFVRCRLTERQDLFLSTRFEDVEFDGCTLTQAIFVDADLRRCRFVDCDLTQVHLIKPQLDETCFDGSTLGQANIIQAQAGKASFRGGLLRNIRFIGGCQLPGAVFADAVAEDANFRECDLSGADFTGARCERSEFGDARMSEARMSGMRARQAQFANADLARADLRGADLMEASFLKASLLAADFREANLYSASFLGSTLGSTRFDGARLDNTLLKDWRPR